MKTITASSDTGGLWVRMITKLLSYWIGGYWFIVVTNFLNTSTVFFMIQFLSALAIVGYYSYVVLKDHPLKWSKEVTFDFDRQLITITKDNHRRNADDILDEHAKTIAFAEIEHLKAAQYDSFLFSAYFRISVVTNGQEEKLLALKTPILYNDILGQMKKAGVSVG
ncbi:hypothetical protein [Lewinella cohaerens]|uniref:hypothetical protein n=1 Tax=Lewinella cohaerens TaxID=70995 RepID=UPI00037F6E63|nr:hypothetical protein [Lewinella cohaerens]